MCVYTHVRTHYTLLKINILNPTLWVFKSVCLRVIQTHVSVCLKVCTHILYVTPNTYVYMFKHTPPTLSVYTLKVYRHTIHVF